MGELGEKTVIDTRPDAFRKWYAQNRDGVKKSIQKINKMVIVPEGQVLMVSKQLYINHYLQSVKTILEQELKKVTIENARTDTHSIQEVSGQISDTD